ncbi:MAG: hypothetical protein J6A21_00855, partial [Lentisphaeria bacterium]|nr:hypothetical protein [Lentisphaeria bacterium]
EGHSAIRTRKQLFDLCNLIFRKERSENSRNSKLLCRFLSAFAGLLTAFLLYFASVSLLEHPPLFGFFGSLSFLLLPPTLFYSRTSNMDMPVCFWFVFSLFLAAWAECKFAAPEKRKQYLLTHFLAGICCGCAFCTKDQIYSLYILPAAAFFLLKWKKEKSVPAAFLPFLLWGAAFLAATTLIYTLISWELFLPHFRWITGEGSAPYAVAGRGLVARLKLLGTCFVSFGQAADLPLLLFFLFGVLFAFRRGKALLKERKLMILFSLFLLVLFSQFLFFSQVVRYSLPRYFLPLLPIALLLVLEFLYGEVRAGAGRKAWGGALLLFLFQCGISFEFLYGLTHSPLALLKEELKTSRLPETVRICTGFARTGEKVLQTPDGKTQKRLCIRSWGTFLGLETLGIRDLVVDDLSLFLIRPGMILCGERSAFLEKNSYTLSMTFSRPTCFLPTLWETGKEETLFLYCAAGKPGPLTGFAKERIEEQIIRLDYLLSLRQDFSYEEMKFLGMSLAPFAPPDAGKYLIRPHMFRFLFDAYTAAGRKADAEKCRSFLPGTP